MKHPSETVESTVEPVTQREPAHPPPMLSGLDEVRFSVGEETARGGIGRILKAYDDLLGREVALKQLIHSGDEAMARFMREAVITARLQHPSIVSVYDAGVR